VSDQMQSRYKCIGAGSLVGINAKVQLYIVPQHLIKCEEYPYLTDKDRDMLNLCLFVYSSHSPITAIHQRTSKYV